MISRVQSGAVLGIDGYSVEVEVNLAMGIPGMSIVGLPDAAVKESSDRIMGIFPKSQPWRKAISPAIIPSLGIAL